MQNTGKRDLAPGKSDNAEKKIEKLEKEKAEAQAKAKQERSMKEKLAREAVQVAKAEAARVYTMKEIVLKSKIPFLNIYLIISCYNIKNNVHPL